MTQLSREQLIEELERRIAVTTQYPGVEEAKLDAQIFKFALAALAAEAREPYGYVHKWLYENCGSSGLSNDHEAHRDSRTHIPLYAAPQPVAVPDKECTCPSGDGSLRWPCPAHQVEPVSQPYTLPSKLLAAVEEVLRISDRDHEAWHRARDGIAAYRAAMLQPSSGALQLPDGWKLVPIEPTMEILDEFDSIIDHGAEDSKDAWSRLLAAAWLAAPQEPTK